MYGPADPTSLLLNTLAHNGGSVTQAPNVLLPSPKKQETRICRALVFILISCFAAPSPDYFLYFFSGSSQIGRLINLFVGIHLETNCFLSTGCHKMQLTSHINKITVCGLLLAKYFFSLFFSNLDNYYHRSNMLQMNRTLSSAYD